ncbi:hypothetical protein EON80_00785 [bacterium]|nr:MAG: hypothetical protein EON80_00785 [bacterium]
MKANLLQNGWAALRFFIRAIFGGMACAVLGGVLIGAALAYVGLLVQLDSTPLPDDYKYGKDDAMSGLFGGICFAGPFCGATGAILFGFFSLLCEPNDSLLPSKAVILKIATRMAKTAVWMLLFYLTLNAGDPSYFLALNEGIFGLMFFMMGAMFFCQLAGLIRDWHDRNLWSPLGEQNQLQENLVDSPQ